MLEKLQRRFALWRAASLDKPFTKSLRGGELDYREIGALGEELAAKYLRLHGRKVLGRNFAPPEGGEADIVCRHGKALTFVEVKTRTSFGVRRPADAVTKDKQQLIIRGARAWMRMLRHPRVPYRFDIVEVMLIEGELPQLNIVQDAFQA